jgi:hypothetical protein
MSTTTVIWNDRGYDIYIDPRSIESVQQGNDGCVLIRTTSGANHVMRADTVKEALSKLIPGRSA